MPDEKFALTRQDRASGTWVRLKAHLENELATLRKRNDGPMTWDETLALRGRIQCLKDILLLGDDMPPIDG